MQHSRTDCLDLRGSEITDDVLASGTTMEGVGKGGQGRSWTFSGSGTARGERVGNQEVSEVSPV